MKPGEEMSPSVKKLFIYRMSRDAIPDGGGLSDGISFFTDPDKRKAIMRRSEEWVIQALDLIRSASDPNPWRDASDEDIATEILRRVESKGAL